MDKNIIDFLNPRILELQNIPNNGTIGAEQNIEKLLSWERNQVYGDTGPCPPNWYRNEEKCSICDKNETRKNINYYVRLNNENNIQTMRHWNTVTDNFIYDYIYNNRNIKISYFI